MDTILNSSEQTFQVPKGGTLTMRQSSPGAAAVCALQFSDAPIAFTTAVLNSGTPVVVGPYNANTRLMVAAIGQIAVEVDISVAGTGGAAVGLVNALNSTDSTQALAASVGPTITSQIAAAQNQAGIATNSASDAVAAAATANAAASSAVSTAGAAVVTANNAAILAGLAAPKNNPVMTGNVGMPTRNPGDNTANGASTAFVQAAVAAVAPGNAVLTPFNQLIAFDTSRYSNATGTVGGGPILVTGPLTFTVNVTGANVGGEWLISLQADGVNLPTFSGMTQVGSQAYSNVAGQVYDILFFKTVSGYYYGITLGPAIDVTPPTLVSASVANATPSQLDLVWSEAMNAAISAPTAFAVSSGHTITAHTRVDATHSYLTLGTAFAFGESAKTLAYSQPASNKMQDLAGNLLANIASSAINNNLLDTTPPVVSTRTVQDAAPNVIEVVFSKPLAGYPTLGLLPASSAFGVSGHAVSSIAWGTSASMVKLTLATNFVTGESQSMSYAQPGTNNLADASGNLLANFAGQAIADNVNSPTLVSAVVQNTTPNKIDLTWSKAMNATVLASGTNFAVSSGHPVTGHVNLDSTHSQLTTSTPFAAGETVTLAYTAGGSSDMKDSVGGNLVQNFTGAAITDNVTTTIFSDGFVSGDRALNGWTPDTNNTEGNTWLCINGSDKIQYGTLVILTSGIYTGSRYQITSRKNFTLTLGGVYFNAGDGQSYRFYVRDDSTHAITNEIGYSAPFVDFTLSGGAVTVQAGAMVNGAQGSLTTIGTVSSIATDGSPSIQLVLSSSDTCQVQVNNGSGYVAVGSAFSISGSNFGIRICSANGAINTVTVA